MSIKQQYSIRNEEAHDVGRAKKAFENFMLAEQKCYIELL